jgi:nucleoid DNA-binding protein
MRQLFSVPGGNMGRSQLIEVLAKTEGLTMKKAEAVVETLFEAMAKALEEGDRVEIRGLCAFKVEENRPYQGRNPRPVKPSPLATRSCLFSSQAGS